MTQITNADGKIWVALSNRLAAWTETRVMLPEVVFQPEADESYLIVQDVGLESDIRPLNQDCGEVFSGLLNVSVMVPLGWTWAQHKGLAGRVADFISASGVLVYQDARVRFQTRAKVIGAARLDQSWNRCEVQAEYRCWG